MGVKKKKKRLPDFCTHLITVLLLIKVIFRRSVAKCFSASVNVQSGECFFFRFMHYSLFRRGGSRPVDSAAVESTLA